MICIFRANKSLVDQPRFEYQPPFVGCLPKKTTRTIYLFLFFFSNQFNSIWHSARTESNNPMAHGWKETPKNRFSSFYWAENSPRRQPKKGFCRIFFGRDFAFVYAINKNKISTQQRFNQIFNGIEREKKWRMSRWRNAKKHCFEYMQNAKQCNRIHCIQLATGSLLFRLFVCFFRFFCFFILTHFQRRISAIFSVQLFFARCVLRLWILRHSNVIVRSDEKECFEHMIEMFWTF